MTKVRNSRLRSWWRIVGVTLLAMLVLGAIGFYLAWRRVPAGVKEDIRSGIAARNNKDPNKRLGAYLEHRYGSMDDPANREKVFLDFFNLEHIKAMQWMVRHSPEEQRLANIKAMEEWVKGYRENLSAAERARLRQQFATAQGRAMLKQATAQYNQQDVQYRGQTAPVISELLKTIHSVEHQ